MKSKSFLAATLAAAVITAAAHAADWPQWRGPRRDSISEEEGLLREWPKAGPKLLWRAQGAGFGYGSPAVVRDRLYVVSSEGTANESVKALSARDGKPIWSTRIGRVGNP